jgi:hypothetical protein
MSSFIFDNSFVCESNLTLIRRILKSTDYDILEPLTLQEVHDKYIELEKQINSGNQQKSMQQWKIHVKTPKSSPKFQSIFSFLLLHELK